MKRNFESEIKAMHPNIKILSEVVNGSTKVKLKCSLDDYEWESRPYDLLRGHGCHYCNGVPRYTTKSFKEKIRKINPNIIILGEYKNARKKLEWKCAICKTTNQNDPNSLLSGAGCPKCVLKKQSESQRKTDEMFKEEIFELVGNEYTVFGKYTHTDKDVEFIHEKCGHHFKSRPHNFLKGTRCPKCNGGVRRKDTEYFKEEVSELTNGEYIFAGKYTVNSKTYRFVHKKCGLPFRTSADSFLNQGTRCPNCHFMSKGELEIFKILNSMKIDFIQQKTFEDLRDVRPLRYDFFLPDYNLCIEFDGSQHFEPKKHWGGLVEFENIKRKDEMKNKYCEDNGIGLLRINYKEKDLAGLIRERLNV